MVLSAVILLPTASASGSMELMSVDIDPAGNTVTTLGAHDECVEICAKPVTIDITALNIPEATGMVTFSDALNYDAANLSVTAADHNFLAASGGGSSLLHVEVLPARWGTSSKGVRR